MYRESFSRAAAAGAPHDLRARRAPLGSSPMNITLLTSLPSDAGATRSWLHDGLVALGHQVHLVDRPDLAARDAAELGYTLADSWRGSSPDALLAVGWVAGVAAQVATREHPTPVLLRLVR